MSVLQSNINTVGTTFASNKKAMQEWITQLEKHLEASRFQGKESSIEKARRRNKFLARERIELLLDRDSPFLELMPLAGLEKKGGFGAGGTTVSGIGLVEGKLCMINANVGTRKGGAVDFSTVFKGFRIGQITKACKLPSINLVESGGANLPDQSKIFNYGGEGFREITRRSELGITTISVVFGNATAGGAYIPGMSDYAIFQKQAAKVFLAGPPLVKMATNEIATDEELGGAEMHSKISGVSDYLADDEYDAIRIAREIMSFIPVTEPQLIPEHPIEKPLYNEEEIAGIIPANTKTPFDIRELIMRITDGSKFAEFKKEYGNTMVCGWTKIHGHPVGKKNIPLLFLQNTTGYMVGKKYEEGGIIKNGAKLINAVSNSKVPSITLMVNSSYGAGNYGMNGRSYEPDFLFAEAANKAKGIPNDEEKMKMIETMLVAEADAKSSAWHSTSELWDDGIINPKETRNYLGFALAVLYNQKIEGSNSYGVWRH